MCYTKSLSLTLEALFATRIAKSDTTFSVATQLRQNILQSGTSTEAKSYIILYDYPQRQYQVANEFQQ